MFSKMIFAKVCLALALLIGADAYSSGAPESACKDMIPRHPVEAQTRPAPYKITTSTKVVKAGTPMEVTLSGNSPSDTIRGIMLQARGSDDKPVGTFTVSPNNPLARLMKCDNKDDTITHKKHDAKEDKQTATFTWTPPATLNDVVKFRATIALNGAVFWVGVESAPVKVSA
ncbi:putative defense protein Hdd11 isoform X1 [Pieris brassicae]|uniref:putative defense protein Hdd11 isoform X1 n=2 Tax=Pieris brassicae TaxID=7116 RepID=UPI001E65FD36|nr:putative defense protein Hdd11 isoform X1 [Pieris brassicae]